MALEYRDILLVRKSPAPEHDDNRSATQTESPSRLSLSEEELAIRLKHAANAAAQDVEERLRDECARRIEAERARIGDAVVRFEQRQTEYYAQVEPELVHLILAVAGKILHREAQVDRLLVAALAKVAVENLQQRSHVILRVVPDACGEWREYFSAHLSGTKVEVIEDSELQAGSCVLETELGMAEVGIEGQLKEIERGFFDLLAKRPER
jgi:flagellar assembly protein FliH